jgi:hypothetical protein
MSVTKLIIHANVVKFDSVAFETLLTRTQTLQKLHITGFTYEAFHEVQIAAIVSGFAKNTTLRELGFKRWREADLTPVLTALQDHPALQKVCFHGDFGLCLPSLSGLEVLLRRNNSKVKELLLEQVDTHTIGLHSVLRELGRNTTVTNLAIVNSVLSREIVLQLTAVVRQNTALQHLNLKGNRLRNAGLAEISAKPQYIIKTLDLSSNDLDDIESRFLRELLLRNKTITNLCIARNAFGRNAAAARSIFEGLRSNTAPAA